MEAKPTRGDAEGMIMEAKPTQYAMIMEAKPTRGDAEGMIMEAKPTNTFDLEGGAEHPMA